MDRKDTSRVTVKRVRRLLVLASCLLFIAPVGWVASAYAFQLSQAPILAPVLQAAPVLQVAGNFARTSSSPLHDGPPRSETFVTDLIKSVGQKNARLLWSTYPASIRGQVFSGQSGGNNPLEASSGGW